MSSLGSLTSIYSGSLPMCVSGWGSDVSLILIFKTGSVEYLAGKRPCHCWYCSIVFVIVPVTVAVSTHLHVVYSHFHLFCIVVFKARSHIRILP